MCPPNKRKTNDTSPTKPENRHSKSRLETVPGTRVKGHEIPVTKNNNRVTRDLKCISLNACSLGNKATDIRSLLEFEDADILCITETHLNDDVFSSEIFLDH